MKSNSMATLEPPFGMYNSKLFTLEIFPYTTTFDAWTKVADYYGVTE
jgi:hypothetical protein